MANMPQPLSRVRTDPGLITLSAEILEEMPELATLAMQIIARWARIEHELGLLLMRLLGAAEGPALAIYSVLTGQGMQNLALSAAARSVLSDEDFKTFTAVVNVATSAGKKRHKLAHWIWGKCEALPGVLLLADPQSLVETEKVHMLARAKKLPPPSARTFESFVKWNKQFGLDGDRILVYRKTDLQRELDDMHEVAVVLFWYRQCIQPTLSDEELTRAGANPNEEGTSAAALRQLSTLKPFQEALARLEKDKSSNPESPP